MLGHACDALPKAETRCSERCRGLSFGCHELAALGRGTGWPGPPSWLCHIPVPCAHPTAKPGQGLVASPPQPLAPPTVPSPAHVSPHPPLRDPGLAMFTKMGEKSSPQTAGALICGEHFPRR